MRRSIRIDGRRVAVLSLVVASLVLGCADLSRQQQKALEPSTEPAGTVSTLYGDKTFFELRNSIPDSVVDHLSACITAGLRSHFERHNEAVEAWMARNEGAGLKLPVPAGPIFLSNYEGAGSYRVGVASVEGDLAKVPISFSISDTGGTLEWVDVALLRRVGDVWLLDDIHFQPEGDSLYTLRDRIALVE